MREVKIFCDCCGEEIKTTKYGEAKMCDITIPVTVFDVSSTKLFPFRQEICYQCGTALRDFYTARQKEFGQKK